MRRIASIVCLGIIAAMIAACTPQAESALCDYRRVAGEAADGDSAPITFTIPDNGKDNGTMAFRYNAVWKAGDPVITVTREQENAQANDPSAATSSSTPDNAPATVPDNPNAVVWTTTLNQSIGNADTTITMNLEPGNYRAVMRLNKMATYKICWTIEGY